MKIALSGSSGSIGKLLKKYLAKKHNISTISFREKRDINEEMLVHRNDVFIHLASLNANLTCDSDRLLELDIAKKAMKFCRRHGLMAGLTAMGRVERDTRCDASPRECGKPTAGRSASRHGSFYRRPSAVGPVPPCSSSHCRLPLSARLQGACCCAALPRRPVSPADLHPGCSAFLGPFNPVETQSKCRAAAP